MPLRLGVDASYVIHRTVAFALDWLVFWIVAVEAGRRLLRPGRKAHDWVARGRAAWRRLTPVRAVWLVAAASVVVGCYPVIFCGKSFASPNFIDGTYQLYEQFPTLPGSRDSRVEDGHGSEVGVMAWQAAPTAVVASRALFRHGELPLWNRYDNAGEPLLASGQSMVGDPLHWLVLAGGGRAWAWDAKFILAKWLFAVGVGLLVLAATGCLPAALLLCCSSAFLGFFAYRLNHPAYFSLCYAPWMLLAWVEIARAGSWRRAMGWAGGWLLATWAEIHSGSYPEAFAQVIYLNGCGLLLLLLLRRPVEAKFQRLLGLLVAVGILLLLALPVFKPFFDLSRPPAAAGQVTPVLPGAFIGLFDDIFYRQSAPQEGVLCPSTNFLVFVGVLLALSRCKNLVGDRLFTGIFLGALPPAAVFLGLVSPDFVRNLPLVGGTLQPDVLSAGVLIVPLCVLAGFGFRECLRASSRGRWWRDWSVAALAGLVLVYAYFVSAPMAPTPIIPPGATPVAGAWDFSAFFWSYVPVAMVAAGLLPVVLRRLRFRGPTVATVLLLACCLFLIHWRLGVQLHGAFSRYTPTLPSRPNLLASSKALDFLHADREGPYRGVGLGATLMGGYNGIAGIESIGGPDVPGGSYLNELKSIGLKLGKDWARDAADKGRLAATKRVYDLLNVRYFVTMPGDSLAAVPGLRLIGELDLDVYRNEQAWPRAFFVDRLERYEGVEQFVKQVMDGDPAPFAAVETSDLPRLPELAGRLEQDRAGRMVVPAANYRLSGNGTEFEVQVPRAGVIVLSESFINRSIFAWIDGHPAKVFRVNHAFRGIVVDRPGLCRVAFSYHPPKFGLMLGSAAAGLALLAGAWWVLRRLRPAPAAPGETGKSDWPDTTVAVPPAPPIRPT